MTITPITQRAARHFISRHHRHNMASITAIFCVGLSNGSGELIGAAMTGLPKARLLMDGSTLEVTRVCVLPDHRNANSMLYGACARAAAALGYKRLVTYTLPTESGISLKAAGWTPDAALAGGGDWTRHTKKPGRGAVDMFGNERIPQGPKIRWWKQL